MCVYVCAHACACKLENREWSEIVINYMCFTVYVEYNCDIRPKKLFISRIGVQLLALFLTVMERRKGFITSGVQFMFWLLLAITQIVPFYTLIELKV